MSIWVLARAGYARTFLAQRRPQATRRWFRPARVFALRFPTLPAAPLSPLPHSPRYPLPAAQEPAMHQTRFALIVTAPLLAATFLGSAAPARAATLAVQGRLASVSGGPVADGSYPLAVSLYVDSQTADALYNEKFLAVQVAGGVFALPLGQLDPKVKIDDAMFTSSKAKWVGVQVAGEPELPRAPLHPVPYAVSALHALSADDLQCSGCVGEADLAKGAVTADKIGTGAVKPEHVAFAYAGSDDKGGSAKHALTADSAKAAQSAANADFAAKSDEAATASVAKSLACTGCVLAGHIANNAIGAQHLADDVAKKYLPLAGGTVTGDFAVQGATTLGALGAGAVGIAGVTTHGWNEIQQFRVHVADAAPTKCDGGKVGAVYFDTKLKALAYCDGSGWVSVKPKVALGSDPSEPGTSCLAIKSAGPAPSGTYWLDPNGGTPGDAFQTWCEMTLAGGGWTLVYVAGNDARPGVWKGNAAPITGASHFGSAGTGLAQVFDAAKNGPGDGVKNFSIVAKELFEQSAKREVLLYMAGPADDYMTLEMPAKCNPFDPAVTCGENTVTGLEVRDAKGAVITKAGQVCGGKGDSCGHNEFGFHLLDGAESNNCACHVGNAGTGFQGIGRLWTTFNRSDGGFWSSGVHSAWKGAHDQPGALLLR
ncbi:MAG: hypothetical protein EXR79_16020 [Myxococcales bacterium]|nr:hypothetical protein [Myxococcales bacterium]